MGVSRRARHFSAPVAAALVLVLAGSTSTVRPSGATTVTPPATAGSSQLTSAATKAPAAGAAAVSSSASEAVLPPAVRVRGTSNAVAAVADDRVTGVLLQAYRSAAASAPGSCHLQVSLLAAIGEVESGSLVGRTLDSHHRASVFGPVLDGKGFSAVPDTDGGRLDGDTRWDRAVGPMQFLPSTWRTFGVDADGDGIADPQDVDDAAAATAAYLCYGGRDLSQPAVLRSAILSYNHSAAYVRLVTTYQRRYALLGLDRGAPASGSVATLTLQATPVGGLGDLTAADPLPAAVPSTTAPSHHRTTTPSDAPAATRTPSPSPTRSSTPTPHPSTTAEPTPTPTPSASPTPSATPTPTASPTGKPTPSPTPTPSPSTSPSTSPTPSPTGSPTACPPVTTPSPIPTVSPTPDPADPLCPPCGTVEGSPLPTPTPTDAAGSTVCPPVVGSSAEPSA